MLSVRFTDSAVITIIVLSLDGALSIDVTDSLMFSRLLRTMSLVGTDTGGVHGQVTDVVLFMHSCEQVSQGSSGMDDDVIASVCL